MDIHPNILAAIGAAQIGFKVPETVLCDRHDNSKNVTNGIGMYTGEFLDALASLSVAAADSQVVAIALQMGSPSILTVAENGDVKPELLDHLRDMLDSLQRMAVEYANMGDWNGPPTEIPLGVRPYRNKLIRSVYLYSVNKILQRFERHWARLLKDLRLCDARGNAKMLGGSGQWFERVLCSIDDLRKFLWKIKRDKNSITQDEWAHLIGEMDGTARCLASGNHTVAEIFKGPHPHSAVCCVPLLIRLADPTTGTLCVGILKKLCSHHHHIQNLTTIAHAVRVNPTIRFEMVVCEGTVCHGDKVELPKEIEELELMIGVITKHKIRPNDRKTTEAIFENFRKVPLGKVHCECALITHLDNLPPKDSPVPCNYIGVSKLSCAPCGVWIHAFNATRDLGASVRTYHTMGTHSKWYRNWAMPHGFPSDWLIRVEMEPILREKLALGFREFKPRWVSDSTIVASPSDMRSRDRVDDKPYPLLQWKIDNGSHVFLPLSN